MALLWHIFLPMVFRDMGEMSRNDIEWHFGALALSMVFINAEF